MFKKATNPISEINTCVCFDFKTVKKVGMEIIKFWIEN